MVGIGGRLPRYLIRRWFAADCPPVAHDSPRVRYSCLEIPMPVNPLSLFHPAVSAWFEQAFKGPTPAQIDAWPSIKAGRHTLIAAPTGSGKTLAAFLAAIDGLVREGVAGTLRNETQVVYVSPLKALDRKSTRLNSSHTDISRMPSSA